MCSLAIAFAGDFLAGQIPFPVSIVDQLRLDVAAGILDGGYAVGMRTGIRIVFRIPGARGKGGNGSDGQHGGKEGGFDLHMLVFGFSVWTVDWIAKVQWVKLRAVEKPSEKKLQLKSGGFGT